MHSSRMRTGRTLTGFQSLLFWGGCTCLVPGGSCLGWGGVWSQGGLVLGGSCQGGCTCLVPRGSCLVWGCVWSQGGSGPGGLLPGGMYLPGPGGCAWSGTPPVNRITHTCKNITLAKTSFRPVMKKNNIYTVKFHICENSHDINTFQFN